MPQHFDFTSDGRRPSAARIIAAWKRANRPRHFTVSYGETFAEFELVTNAASMFFCGWQDSGNGCRGVQRNKVVAALQAEA